MFKATEPAVANLASVFGLYLDLSDLLDPFALLTSAMDGGILDGAAARRQPEAHCRSGKGVPSVNACKEILIHATMLASPGATSMVGRSPSLGFS